MTESMLLRMISTDLSMLKGPNYLENGKTYRVGRSSDCSFVVNDLSVSRFHAELVVNGESVRIKDLGSLNGTFVEGVRVDEAELQPGQAVVFGAAQFRLANNDTPKAVVNEVSDVSTYVVHPAALELLSEAQRRVLDLLLTGLAEKEIASKLGKSPHTVHNQIKEIYRRLDVNSRAELLARFVSEAKLPDKPAK